MVVLEQGGVGILGGVEQVHQHPTPALRGLVALHRRHDVLHLRRGSRNDDGHALARMLENVVVHLLNVAGGELNDGLERMVVIAKVIVEVISESERSMERKCAKTSKFIPPK